MKKSITDFLKPIFQNGEEITTKKWINSLLFLVGVQFIFFLYEIIFTFNWLDPTEFTLAIVLLIYIPCTGILLFKRHKWGWILLFFEKLLTIVICTILLVVVLTSWYIEQEMVGDLFWGIAISALFISYLVKKEVYSYFKMNKEKKMRYSKWVGLVVLVMSITILLFYLQDYGI